MQVDHPGPDREGWWGLGVRGEQVEGEGEREGWCVGSQR